jgi:ABC-type transport system involved in multi-copper enzyme maturation permease subunit
VHDVADVRCCRCCCFVPTPTGIQAILYFIFGNNMIALAFLLSCFFSSSKTATVFAYLVVFGTGLIGSLLLSQLINAGQWYTTLLQLVPSFALFRWVYAMDRHSGCSHGFVSAKLTPLLCAVHVGVASGLVCLSLTAHTHDDERHALSWQSGSFSAGRTVL